MQEDDSNANMGELQIEAANKPPIKTPICFSVRQIEVLQTLGNRTFVSQYESDEFIQKVIGLLKKPDTTKINRLPTPWREKFKCLSLDANKFLYMDERFVVPKALRPITIGSVHYGHPGRETMLATVSNVWWPRVHREVVVLAKTCAQCQEAGMNIKTFLKQKQVGKLPQCTDSNQEIAVDFAGPFQNAVKAKKYPIFLGFYRILEWPCKIYYDFLPQANLRSDPLKVIESITFSGSLLKLA